MTTADLADTLRGVSDALERTAAVVTSVAIPPLEQAKAALVAVKRAGDGWYPTELDLAVVELRRTAELVLRAQQAVADYLTRL